MPHRSFGSGLFHLAGKEVDDFFEIAGAFGKIRAFGADIGVVETEIGLAEDLEQLERRIRLGAPHGHGVAEPGPLKRGSAERIAALPGKGMPIGHGKAQMLGHGLAAQNLRGVVVAEGQRVVALGAFIGNGGDIGKVAHQMSFRAL